MNEKSFFRIVGWGPLPMPGERRRWQKARQKAQELVALTEQTHHGDWQQVARSDSSASRRASVDKAGRADSGTHQQPYPSMSADRYEFKVSSTDSCIIGVIPGDILEIHGIAIWVNGENTDMEMARETENSISGIIRYWGGRPRPAPSSRLDKADPKSDLIAHLLAKAVAGNAPVQPGTAFCTDSGRLRESNGVRYIIHVAAVQGEPGAGYQRVRNIGLCVTNTLKVANELATTDPEAGSILFPLLGTGMGGAALEPTVRKLIKAALHYVEDGEAPAVGRIYFLAYTDAELEVLLEVLRSEPGLEPVGTEDANSPGASNS